MPDHNDIFDAFRLCYGVTTKVNKDKNEKLKDADGIYITREGDTVTAVAVKNLKFIALGDKIEKLASATAKCSPDDIFDFNIGAKLAMDRLYEGYDMTPKQKRKPYNGKIFVEVFPGGSLVLPHHIYTVKNGCLVLPGVKRDPYIFFDMDDNDLSIAIHAALWDSSVKNIAHPLLFCKTRAYFVKG